jgi:cobaltochelatase CobS
MTAVINGTNGVTAGTPDRKVSVSQLFGFESNMEVPAYSEPTEHVPDLD